jgi:hypothetical protein
VCFRAPCASLSLLKFAVCADLYICAGILVFLLLPLCSLCVCFVLPMCSSLLLWTRKASCLYSWFLCSSHLVLRLCSNPYHCWPLQVVPRSMSRDLTISLSFTKKLPDNRSMGVVLYLSLLLVPDWSVRLSGLIGHQQVHLRPMTVRDRSCRKVDESTACISSHSLNRLGTQS